MLRADFAEVKDLPCTTLVHASIHRISEFEADKTSLPFASQDDEFKKLLLHNHKKEPTPMYANGNVLGAVAWGFNHLPEAHRAFYDMCEVAVDNGGNHKKMSIDVLFWFQWQQDYHTFHQCVTTYGTIGQHTH